MRTSKLIRALAADTAHYKMSLDEAWTLSAVLAVAGAAIAFFSLLGVRPDFDEALESVRFLHKFAVTLALAVSAYVALRALSRPASPINAPVRWLFASSLLLISAIVKELTAVSPAQWVSKMVGTNSIICLTYIPLMGLFPLAIIIIVLRFGAPTRPMLTGALAGVCAGGVSATFYAAQCTDDSPLFVATWYTMAIAALAICGALSGPRLLRW